MLKRRIDKDGYFIEDIITDEISDDLIEVPVPEGMYKPKWLNSEWVEDLTEEEIEIIKNQASPMTEEEKLKERISALEDALIFIMDMQGGLM